MEKKMAMTGESGRGSAKPGVAPAHGPAAGREPAPGFGHEAVEVGVEAICNKGCQAVRDDLAALERGETPPELAKLGPGERREVYLQLRAIMAVYGDVCRLT